MSSPARGGAGAPEHQAAGGGETDTEKSPAATTGIQEGKGTWRHAAFHVATTIATPAAYAPLPFAVASLGWPLGVFSLVAGTLVSWCSSLAVASLWQWNGEKHTSYRLLAKSIFGPWGCWYVTFFQQVASVGNNIAILLFGAFELLLSQLPDIHSLRWINAICTACTVGFAGTSIGVTLYQGHQIDREEVNYSVQGSTATKIFRAFNALGTIAFSFGDAMLPEIQSTVREPVRANMYRGVSAAYTIIVISYWSLAFSGYWAFGSQVQTYILSSLTAPRWAITMANLFAVIQITGCFQIYCRPTFAHFEEKMVQVKNKSCTSRSWLWRIMYTSPYMAVITLVSAAMPFFGDFVSICGAVGFTPLDFVLPALAFLKARKLPDSDSDNENLGLQYAVKALGYAVVAFFSIIGALACIGAVRSIALDVKTYRFFHDM